MRKKLLVAGGGTGGHVLAGIAIAEEWVRRLGASSQHDILFVGASQGLEARLVPQYGYRLERLRIGALNRVDGSTRLLTLFWLPFAFLKAFFILVRFRPTAVIGVGGYASGPMVLLARIMAPILGTYTAILEQNSVAGFTNRLLGKVVHRVYCAFEEGTRSFLRESTRVTGNPIRSNFRRLPPSQAHPFTLFIFGGSQGAKGINTMILDALPYLKTEGIDWIHQTGVADYERVCQEYQRQGVKARVEKFIDDMEACYQKASLVVCRAGASTLSELASVGRAAIFIPLPTAADQHQEKNARIFESAGAAWVVNQGSLSGRAFADQILQIKRDQAKVRETESKVTAFYKSDAAAEIVQDLASAGGVPLL